MTTASGLWAQPTPAAPTLATLVLESDVPGASVFVNREYVGTTPLRLDKLEPGTRVRPVDSQQ